MKVKSVWSVQFTPLEKQVKKVDKTMGEEVLVRQRKIAEGVRFQIPGWYWGLLLHDVAVAGLKVLFPRLSGRVDVTVPTTPQYYSKVKT